MIQPHDTSRGFTLVETLIAIAILTFAIVGPFYAAQGVLATAYVARDELIATALAQEALEYTLNTRDNNFIYNIRNSGTRSALYGLDGTGGSINCFTNGCAVDVGQQTAEACTEGPTCSSRPLYVSPTGLYTRVTSGNTLTKFTRSVTFTSLSATTTKITVTVRWVAHGSYQVSLNQILTTWL